MNLGKLQKIDDLRSIWKHEANDFTPWLAKDENLELLSEAVGIDIVLEERESSVGGFSVDLYAKEEGSGRNIIIENQLEETNHDHLGKLITYASGKNADVIIWIVRKARDEHKQAIEWLNRHTDDEVAFFLIEIELWRINDSAPAVKFNVIERPNDWARAMKRNESLSPTENLRLDFWTAFNSNASTNKVFENTFNLRTPQAQSWYDLSVGSSAYHICMTVSPQKNHLTAGLYIDSDKSILPKLQAKEEELVKIFGSKPEWRTAKTASRFLFEKKFDVTKTETWSQGFAWLYEMSLKIKESLVVLDK